MKYILDLDDSSCTHECGMDFYQCKQIPWWSVSNRITSKLPPYTEPDRKAIEDEVWEFARRIICPSDCCEDSIFVHTKEIFNKEGWEIRGIFNGLSYQEAKSKYEEWLKQKDEIHVGDEVTSKFGDGVVIDIVGDESVHILGKDGHWNEYEEGEYRKTGRHFPEVAELLEKMRGVEG